MFAGGTLTSAVQMEARAHRAEHQLADVARIPVEAEKKWQQATIDLQTTLAS